jgi:hypothetical protein
MVMRTLGFVGSLIVGISFICFAMIGIVGKSEMNPTKALTLAACGIAAMIGAVAFAGAGQLLDNPARAPRPGPHPQMMAGPQAGAHPQGYAEPIGGQGHQAYAPAYAPQQQGLPQQRNPSQRHGDSTPQQYGAPQE